MNYYYGAIVFAHVVSAIISVGPLFLLLPLIRRLRTAKAEAEDIYLAFIRVIIRLVMHSGHVLVVSGILLILFGPWPWHTSWVVLTIGVMLLSGFFLATGFSSVLKKFHESGNDRDAVVNKLQRTAWIYIGLLMVMLWLMVQKPAVW
ncbi:MULTISPECIES: hypothetical protein [Sporosarcina]|uniref:DUF2269 family protein n=1 Tax=Sporosarcina ureae TaxID=1571 RepID=A0ABN4YKE8_SPOUR|nr:MULTISPECIES: hypothetical protein [Sporosarcina]ARF13372.1 hypothetical protein SporoS204_03745 [Sporosarcina ureae]PIC56037.1 hypothetical protein CSV81_16470 [Sporosarcina sp. P10]PIC59364.1 hypothetical protein CSV80_16465 [Sporosarcina sp. P12(2017)]PIC76458.1 hypothetical protein CSV74_10680 [Sporosarcina sp. P19]